MLELPSLSSASRDVSDPPQLLQFLDEGSNGGAIPVAIPGLEVEVRCGAARVLAGLLCSEELGAGRPLRVEEPFADHEGLGAVILTLGPRDDAPEVGVRGCEPRGAVGHVGGPAEEVGIVLVGGVRGGHGGGGGCTWGGDAEARVDGEAEEGGSGGYRSWRDAAEVRRRRRRRHVLRVWWGRGGLELVECVRRFARREWARLLWSNSAASFYSSGEGGRRRMLWATVRGSVGE